MQSPNLESLHHDSWKKDILITSSSYQIALTLISSKKDLDYLLSKGVNLISHEGACLGKIIIEKDPALFSYVIKKSGIGFIDNYYKYSGHQIFNNIHSKHAAVHKSLNNLDIDYSRCKSFKDKKAINSLLFDLPKNPKNTIHLLSHPKCFSQNKMKKDEIILSMLDLIIYKRSSPQPLGKVWIDLLNVMLEHMSDKSLFLSILSSSSFKGFKINDNKKIVKLSPHPSSPSPSPLPIPSIEKLLKSPSLSGQLVSSFLSSSPPVNKDLSALFLCCVQHGLSGACKELLEYGVNPNTTLSSYPSHPFKGYSAISIASIYGSPSIMKVILSHGANPDWIANNDDKFSCLAYATMNGCEKSVDLLLKHGANPNILDKNKRTPLFYLSIIDKSCLSIANKLLKAGANPNVVDNDNNDIVSFLSSSVGNVYSFYHFNKKTTLESVKKLLNIYSIKNTENLLRDNIAVNHNNGDKKERKI